MKKRVLLVINSDLINAGVPNVVMTIVRELKDEYLFDIVTYKGENGDYDAEFLSYGGEIYPLALLEYSRHKILFLFRKIQISRCIKKILKKHNYAIVHCHNGIESGIFLKYAAKHGIACRISHAHGNYTRKGKNFLLRKYQKSCKKKIAKYSTLRLACSDIAGDTLFEKASYFDVLNPVKCESVAFAKREEHTSLNFLQIGYFCENKNQIFSIKLLKEMVDRGLDANLSFIGYAQEEAYLNKMKEWIEKLQLSNRVQILPKNTDKKEQFSKTDIFLLPSRSEGLPLTLLEAQAAGVRSVASDVISKDVNLGGVAFAKLNDFSDWIKKVEEFISRNETLNVDVSKVEQKQWCQKIRVFYEMR